MSFIENWNGSHEILSLKGFDYFWNLMIAKTHECMGWKKCLQEGKVLNLNVYVKLYVLSNKA